MVEKTKRHIENYKKQDIFADATQAREGIETSVSRIRLWISKDATQAREGIETSVSRIRLWISKDATQAREGIETISCSFETPLT